LVKYVRAVWYNGSNPRVGGAARSARPLIYLFATRFLVGKKQRAEEYFYLPTPFLKNSTGDIKIPPNGGNFGSTVN
jgi:hypothetical protein